jgi:hypothetical protein
MSYFAEIRRGTRRRNARKYAWGSGAVFAIGAGVGFALPPSIREASTSAR